MVFNVLVNLVFNGMLILVGIYLSDVFSLNYQDYFFYEKMVISVEFNICCDGEEFLILVDWLGIMLMVMVVLFNQVDQVLKWVSRGNIDGVYVFEMLL